MSDCDRGRPAVDPSGIASDRAMLTEYPAELSIRVTVGNHLTAGPARDTISDTK